MLTDLAALTPPFLVCAAFLFAVGVFIRHEMRRPKNAGEDDDDDDFGRSPVNQGDANPAASHGAGQSAPDRSEDADSAS
jgi:hypothetical protein